MHTNKSKRLVAPSDFGEAGTSDAVTSGASSDALTAGSGLLRQTLQLVLDAAAPMALVWGKENRLFANAAFTPLTAADATHIASGIAAKTVLESWWEALEPLVQSAFEGQTGRLASVRPGGGELFSVAVSPVRDDAGIPAGALLVATERSAEASGPAAGTAHDLLMQAPALVAILRGREGICQLMNPLFRKLWGDRNVVGKPMREAWPELEGQGYFEIVDRVFSTGEAVYGNEFPATGDWNNDGQPTPAFFNFVYTPYHDATGAVDGVMIFGFEVTQQVELRQQLLVASQQFEFLADTIPQMVWRTEPNGDHDYFNRRWYDYTGLGFQETKDRGWSLVLHPDDYDRTLAVWNHSLETGEPYQIEYRFRRHDGAYRWFLGLALPQHDADGRIVKWFGTCTDIHDQKNFAVELERRVLKRTRALQESNAELERSNKDLEQFAYVASHDLQEPLRKIQIFTELVRSRLPTPLDPAATTYFDKIAASTERMFRLIQDLLNYSRLTRANKAYVRTDLNEILRYVLTDLELVIAQKDAAIESDVLPTIEAIPLQMNQLFFNLINNSLKFTAPGKPPVIRISVRTLSAEEVEELHLDGHRPYAEIILRDNGVGFDPRFARQIFVLFQRLYGRQEYPGTGIGLALCRRIVLNHQGEIFAESQPGEGAAFHIVLPLRQTG